jgi:hypothetical protein
MTCETRSSNRLVRDLLDLVRTPTDSLTIILATSPFGEHGLSARWRTVLPLADLRNWTGRSQTPNLADPLPNDDVNSGEFGARHGKGRFVLHGRPKE